MPSQKKLLERVSLTDGTASEIKQMILRGDVKPGGWLPPQPEIARGLGVGLSTVREAIQGLTLLGILQPQPGRGTLVSLQAPDLLRLLNMFEMQVKELGIPEVYEARRLVETELCKLAAQRASEDDIVRMDEALEKMRRGLADGDALYAKADLEFHLAVATAARNRLLEQFYNVIWGLLKEFAVQVIKIPGFKEYGLQLHTDVFDAIRNRNPQVTQRCTKELMDYSDKIFRASASVAGEHQIKR